MVDLKHGMTRDEIRRELRPRLAPEMRDFEALVDAIFSLANVERLYRPAEVADMSGVPRREVLADLRQGKFGAYYERSDNQPRIAGSAVNRWRDGFRVTKFKEAADGC